MAHEPGPHGFLSTNQSILKKPFSGIRWMGLDESILKKPFSGSTRAFSHLL
jgi:hypothetical protein